MPRKSDKNKKYSAELKKMAVEEYLNNRGSQGEISRKYGILGHHTLKDWILWYNRHTKKKAFDEEKSPSKALCIHLIILQT